MRASRTVQRRMIVPICFAAARGCMVIDGRRRFVCRKGQGMELILGDLRSRYVDSKARNNKRDERKKPHLSADCPSPRSRDYRYEAGKASRRGHPGPPAIRRFTRLGLAAPSGVKQPTLRRPCSLSGAGYAAFPFSRAETRRGSRGGNHAKISTGDKYTYFV